MRRRFADLTAALGWRDAFDDPGEDLRRPGLAYLRHALARPLECRLMFSALWPTVSAQADITRVPGRL
jgi:hypothetical protein